MAFILKQWIIIFIKYIKSADEMHIYVSISLINMA